jgi:hypothetical protein
MIRFCFGRHHWPARCAGIRRATLTASCRSTRSEPGRVIRGVGSSPRRRLWSKQASLRPGMRISLGNSRNVQCNFRRTVMRPSYCLLFFGHPPCQPIGTGRAGVGVVRPPDVAGARGRNRHERHENWRFPTLMPVSDLACGFPESAADFPTCGAVLTLGLPAHQPGHNLRHHFQCRPQVLIFEQLFVRNLTFQSSPKSLIPLIFLYRFH